MAANCEYVYLQVRTKGKGEDAITQIVHKITVGALKVKEATQSPDSRREVEVERKLRGEDEAASGSHVRVKAI